MAKPGDLVLLFPTAVDAVWRQVQAFQPAVNSNPIDVPGQLGLGGALG